jgi:hypothetical protein
MKECFIDKKFGQASKDLIDLVNSILDEYKLSGYTLTLRQLYYQLVARGEIENSIKSYQRTGNIISDARLAGLIDWNMIEDRGRITMFSPHWNDPADIVDSASKQFSIDKWKTQENYVEVMVEKDALSGVLLPVCRKLDIGFTANRGYSSSSAMYEAGKRMLDKLNEGKTVWVLYLGDHDPSGIDMTRDVSERLEVFSGETIETLRLALNMNQIEKLNPPKNPAKESDSRARAYIAKFGNSSWELDAVEPKELDRLVTRAVMRLIDANEWQKEVRRENTMRKELISFVKEYKSRSNKQ